MIRRLAPLLLALGCHSRPAAIAVARAVEVGTVPQSGLIQGHDGAASAMLFGHSVWIYGDTVLNVNDATGVNWHSNSFALTDDLDPADGLSGFEERLDGAGAPVPLLAHTPEEESFNRAHWGEHCATAPCGARWALWPGSPVFDAPRDRAFIWYGLVYAEPGEFNFHAVGQSLAVWDDFASLPRRPEISPGAEHPTLLFAQNEPAYGMASAIDGDFLYSFACDPDFLARPCTLGRVPAAAALERASWSFWNGRTWSPRIGDADDLFDGGLGLTVFRRGSSWIAVYAASLSNDVKARTAPALTGPWSDEVDLFTADRKGDEGSTYDCYAHPELGTDRALFISYTRSNHQGWFGSETVLVRVDLR